MAISFRLGFLREAEPVLSSVSCGNGKCGLGNGLLRNSLSGQWATARLVLHHGLYPCFFNLNRDRSLQECYGQHKALISSETQQDSLYATKRAMLNSHPISDLKERTRLSV
jgi:hypothetical protein